MPYVKNWLHCVWGTKNRIHFLRRGIKFQIISHIRENALKKGIYIDFLNGYYEHLHCLLLLDCDQPLSKVMQLIKGESSYWINKNKLVKGSFEWADEYYAASISESHVKSVREYIKNQEEHHKKKSWEEEYNEFLIQYGFSKIKG